VLLADMLKKREKDGDDAGAEGKVGEASHGNTRGRSYPSLPKMFGFECMDKDASPNSRQHVVDIPASA
jgi:hypothetical protein